MHVSFNIPEDKVSRVVAALKYFYPVPEDEDGVPLFTDNQWAKEAIRRYIIILERRHRVCLAENAIDIDKDDDLLS